MAEPAHQLDHVHHGAGEHEGAAGERHRQEQEGAASAPPDGTPLAAGLAAPARWCAGGWLRQHQQMDGQAGEEVDRGIDQQRAAPAHRHVERARERPEHGRGEAADDGQHGDGAARARSRDLGDGDAGRRAERQGRGDAHRRPAQEVAHQPLAEGERRERDGVERRARRHEGARAGAVDQPADLRRQQRADAEHHRDAGEHDFARQAERLLDVPAQHRGHQEGGAPAHDLREAEACGRPKAAGERVTPPGSVRDRATAGPLRWPGRRRAR